MTPDLHALAEELSQCELIVHYYGTSASFAGQCSISTVLLNRAIDAIHALAKQQAAHEANRAATVAEALHGAVSWLRQNANAEENPEKRAAFIEAHNAIFTMKPPSDMVCVPREPTKGTIDEADVLRYEKAMRAAAKEGE